ncbi:HD-GYP domain-containing protein, partial [Desulfofundulus sp.]|uniref:HD-GYP domain-containing protein n=1 Tax=Desulfofundulus sp. TaxID=2282750 RepID=UPI003C77C332
MLKYQGANRLAMQMLAWHETLYYHAIATAVYTEAVGRALGLQEKELEWLTQGAFFHDCGKITWPSALVSKARLSDDDRKLVNAHPVVGEYYLREYWPDVPDPVCRVIREHHERPGGSGYPNGLKDGDIHPLSLIVAAVEVFTALLEHRPYRDRSFTKAQALVELERQGFLGEVVGVLA